MTPPVREGARGLVFAFGFVVLSLLLNAPQPLLGQPNSGKLLGMVAELEKELGGATNSAPETDAEEREWRHVKWFPDVAPYTVQGLPIEALEPEFNFRKGYSLGFSGDVEDKTHLLPFLRPYHDPSLAKRKRRVLLDLGGKEFNTSALWFLQMYPLKFTEIHVFEAKKGIFTIPDVWKFPAATKGSALTLSDSSRAPQKERLLTAKLLQRIHLHEKFVDIEDQPSKDVINITHFMKDTLGLTADDAVVVKMDIEGVEWRVLPAWMKDPEMPRIVDDLFIEVHYHHPSMIKFHWYDTRFKETRDQANQMFLDLRRLGFYAHPWP